MPSNNRCPCIRATQYVDVFVLQASYFTVPRTRTKFGDRAFSVAGPTVWNNLLESIRSAETLASFKRKLKTYLFNISF